MYVEGEEGDSLNMRSVVRGRVGELDLGLALDHLDFFVSLGGRNLIRARVDEGLEGKEVT